MSINKLQNARKKISEIDEKMAKLFCERMKAAEPIAEYKREHALPLLDPIREEELIRKNLKLINNEDDTLKEYYVSFLKNVMDISKQYQGRLNNGMKIAYSGTEGAFACIASGKIFPDSTLIPYPDFSFAYNAVASGECDAAVIPFENSSAGEVGQAWDLIFSGSLYINGMYELAVHHDLMALPGAALSEIKEVVSHPQALGQCSEFIHKHGMKTKNFVNTAKAAEFVAASGDKTIAAIASAEAAEKYGLEILADGINETKNNTTRFAVLSRAKNKYTSNQNMDCRFILMFTVRNEAGSLARAVDIIGRYGFNMVSLRSRPMKQLLWQYYFCIEAEGSIDSESGKKMLEELSVACDKLKLVGSFKKANQ